MKYSNLHFHNCAKCGNTTETQSDLSEQSALLHTCGYCGAMHDRSYHISRRWEMENGGVPQALPHVYSHSSAIMFSNEESSWRDILFEGFKGFLAFTVLATGVIALIVGSVTLVRYFFGM